MLKKLLSIPLFYSLFIQVASAVSIRLPRENLYDVNIPRNQIGNNSNHVMSAIALVNEYLRFAIGFICFFFLVINGFKLITARGNKDTFKKATTGLIGSAVGIIICFLSYSAVRVIVNLF